MSKSPKSRVRETTTAPYGAEKRRPTNLTLSPEAMEKADRVAAARGTSVSRLVDDLLRALSDAEARPVAEELTPAVKRLLGKIEGVTSVTTDVAAKSVVVVGSTPQALLEALQKWGTAAGKSVALAAD
jgi:copper chaperone CopZ